MPDPGTRMRCRQGNGLQASLHLRIFSCQDDQSIPSRPCGICLTCSLRRGLLSPGKQHLNWYSILTTFTITSTFLVIALLFLIPHNIHKPHRPRHFVSCLHSPTSAEDGCSGHAAAQVMEAQPSKTFPRSWLERLPWAMILLALHSNSISKCNLLSRGPQTFSLSFLAQ